VVAKEAFDGRRQSLTSKRKFECTLSYELLRNDVVKLAAR
jgi:hypothetical protein